MGMQCKFFRDQDIGPPLRHVCGKAEVGLNASEQAAMDHEFSGRVLRSALVRALEWCSQHNVSELACMQLICRKNADVRVWTLRAHSLSGPGKDELEEDLHLCMGTGGARVMLMIAPTLLDRLTE